MAAGAAVQVGLVALVRTDRPGPGPSSSAAVAIEGYQSQGLRLVAEDVEQNWCRIVVLLKKRTDTSFL
jgi:hypothetical protein